MKVYIFGVFFLFAFQLMGMDYYNSRSGREIIQKNPRYQRYTIGRNGLELNKSYPNTMNRSKEVNAVINRTRTRKRSKSNDENENNRGILYLLTDRLSPFSWF